MLKVIALKLGSVTVDDFDPVVDPAKMGTPYSDDVANHFSNRYQA
jgi:hypothetical protein